MPISPSLLKTNKFAGPFQVALQQYVLGDPVMRLVQLDPLETNEWKIADLGASPAFALAAGNVTYATLGEFSMSGTMSHYQAGLEVSRPDWEAHMLRGAIDRAMGQFMQNAFRNRKKLVVNLIEELNATTGYDGVNFFASTHPSGGANQDNTDTFNASSTSNLTVPECFKILNQAIVKLKSFLDDQGELVCDNCTELLIVCNTAHDIPFRTLFAPPLPFQSDVSGAMNLAGYRGYVYSDSRITSTEISIFCLDSPAKSIYMPYYSEPKFSEPEYNKESDSYRTAGHDYCDVAPCAWQTGVQCTIS